MHLWDWTGTGTTFSYGIYEYDPAASDEEIEAIANATGALLDSLNGTNGVYTAGVRLLNTTSAGITKKNSHSEYIGSDKISIFNPYDYFEHNPGGFKFETTPDN